VTPASPFAATLSTSTLATSPGGTVGCDLVVTNTGGQAQTLEVGLSGAAGEWGVVLPDVLRLAPGASARSRLTLDVPRSIFLAGTNQGFSVRVVSRTQAGASVELAGRVAVGELRELRASISPLVARGRGATVHTLTVENRGTAVCRLALRATTVDADLGLRLADDHVVVAPGSEARVALTVAPRRRSLRGASRPRPFTVEVQADAGPAVTAGATHFQDPLRWRRGALAGIVALVALVPLVGGRVVAGRGHDSPGHGVVAAAAVPVASAVAGAACADPSSPDPSQATTHVDIAGFAFCPAPLTVPVGSEVRWVNADLAPHTATYDGSTDGFDSGPLAQGQSWSHVFTQPGTYRYYCQFHTGMSGTIVVA
jgi:plastocyanin